jgi:hypothetical protein
MKLFLDDVRNPPDNSWTVTRDAHKCIALLKLGKVEVISLDHDLGENTPTGYDVLKWIEKVTALGEFTPPKEIRVHSANPVGRGVMDAAIVSIRRFEQMKH